MSDAGATDEIQSIGKHTDPEQQHLEQQKSMEQLHKQQQIPLKSNEKDELLPAKDINLLLAKTGVQHQANNMSNNKLMLAADDLLRSSELTKSPELAKPLEFAKSSDISIESSLVPLAIKAEANLTEEAEQELLQEKSKLDQELKYEPDSAQEYSASDQHQATKATEIVSRQEQFSTDETEDKEVDMSTHNFEKISPQEPDHIPEEADNKGISNDESSSIPKASIQIASAKTSNERTQLTESEGSPVLTSSKLTPNTDSSSGKKLALISTTSSANSQSATKVSFLDGKDTHCWQCHRDRVNMKCSKCVRVYHVKCLPANSCNLDKYGKKTTEGMDKWVCIECRLLIKAENEEGKSDTIGALSHTELNELLSCSLKNIKQVTDPTFYAPVDYSRFSDYEEKIIYPMNISLMEEKVNSQSYQTTTAFITDLKWILHNSCIYNNSTHALSNNARYMLKIAKNEISEIETCPECTRNYYKDNRNFFHMVCSKPHNLVFAKLKGHPMWPSKVVRFYKESEEVEVRFFGAHDKAWLKYTSCFKIYEGYPNAKTPKGQRAKLESAIQEMKMHIEELNRKFPGLFKYANGREIMNPNQLFLNDPDIPYVTGSNEQGQLVKDDADVSTSILYEQTDSNNKELVAISSPAEVAQQEMEVDEQESEKLVIDESKTQSSRPNRSVKKPQQSNTSTSNSTPTLPSAATNVKSTASVAKYPSAPSNQKQHQPLLLKLSKSSLSTPVSSCGIKRPPPQVGGGAGNGDFRALNLISSGGSKRRPADMLADSASSSKKLKVPTLSTKPQLMISNPPAIQIQLNSPPVTVQPVVQQHSKVQQQQQKQQQDSEAIESLKRQLATLSKDFEDMIMQYRRKLETLAIEHEKEKNSMRAEFAREKRAALIEREEELHMQFERRAMDIKRRQWCSFCTKEANYFCCWNSSYCSYECQSNHWPKHMSSCQQKSLEASEGQDGFDDGQQSNKLASVVSSKSQIEITEIDDHAAELLMSAQQSSSNGSSYGINASTTKSLYQKSTSTSKKQQKQEPLTELNRSLDSAALSIPNTGRVSGSNNKISISTLPASTSSLSSYTLSSASTSASMPSGSSLVVNAAFKRLLSAKNEQSLHRRQSQQQQQQSSFNNSYFSGNGLPADIMITNFSDGLSSSGGVKFDPFPVKRK